MDKPVIATPDEAPFDAAAFTARLKEKVAAKRAVMLKQGDPVLAVAVARWIVGGNDPAHEPWLSNMEPLLDEIDRVRATVAQETARAATLEAQVRELQGEGWVPVSQGYPDFFEVCLLAGNLSESTAPPTVNTIKRTYRHNAELGVWEQHGRPERQIAEARITHYRPLPAPPPSEQPQQPAPQGGGRVGQEGGHRA